MKTFSKLGVILLLSLLVLMVISQSAFALNVVNSKDWRDVYSLMLSSSMTDDPAVFVKSETFTDLTKLLPSEAEIDIYSSDNAFISNLDAQLSAAGYPVASEQDSSSLMFDLDPQTGKYVLIAEENFRTAVPLISYAKHSNSWVFLVNADNVDEIADIVQGADEVLGVGSFRRDIAQVVEPLFTDRINTESIFLDSQEIASRFSSFDRVVVGDGTALEAEFFNTDLPVLLAGSNKILDDTFAFLQQNNVRSVVIVGNQLASVGDQIRQRSNKQISVFIKFGQSDAKKVGTLYALSFFPLPREELGLTIQTATYDPEAQQILVTFENTGNTGLYELTTLRIVDGEQELGSASDAQVQFLGVGEVLQIQYDIPIDQTQITESTAVEFFTSYGSSPTDLDSFLTEESKYGPPFTLALGLQSVGNDQSVLSVSDVAYYKNLKRIGVTVANNGTVPAYYSVKINDLIVNGLEEDFYKDGGSPLGAGQTRTTYITAQLDEVDQVENTEFVVSLLYGEQEDLLLKSIRTRVPFRVSSGLNALLVGGIAVAVFVVLILVLLVVFKVMSGTTPKSSTKRRKSRRK